MVETIHQKTKDKIHEKRSIKNKNNTRTAYTFKYTCKHSQRQQPAWLELDMPLTSWIQPRFCFCLSLSPISLLPTPRTGQRGREEERDKYNTPTSLQRKKETPHSKNSYATCPATILYARFHKWKGKPVGTLPSQATWPKALFAQWVRRHPRRQLYIKQPNQAKPAVSCFVSCMRKR